MTPATIHDLLAAASPGPWRYEAGGGHAYKAQAVIGSCLDDTWSEAVDKIVVGEVTGRAMRWIRTSIPAKRQKGWRRGRNTGDNHE